jgi:transketolase
MGRVEGINRLEPFADKWKSFGWHVQEIDGHDFDAIDEAIEVGLHAPGPAVIVARTVKGKGVSFMEGEAIWHYRLPDDAEMATACHELGIDDIRGVLP